MSRRRNKVRDPKKDWPVPSNRKGERTLAPRIGGLYGGAWKCAQAEDERKPTVEEKQSGQQRI